MYAENMVRSFVQEQGYKSMPIHNRLIKLSEDCLGLYSANKWRELGCLNQTCLTTALLANDLGLEIPLSYQTGLFDLNDLLVQMTNLSKDYNQATEFGLYEFSKPETLFNSVDNLMAVLYSICQQRGTTFHTAVGNAIAVAKNHMSVGRSYPVQG